MHQRNWIIFFACLVLATASFSQEPADTVHPVIDQSLAIDTSLDYDDLLDEFGDFMDSILAPRSYFLANVGVVESYFTYKNNARTNVLTVKKLVFSPTVGYYHKSGPGLTLSSNMARPDYYGNKNFDVYQYAVTPSFDFIQSRKWTGGVSYTRYFTKDSVKFYTTPLQNEINAYFLWRKSWVQPGFTFNSGWGSRKDVEKRIEYLNLLRWLKLRRSTGITTPLPVTTVTTTEDIFDLSITLSARHTFYWPELLGKKDLLKLTPMLAFTSGTQKYGFNKTSSSYAYNLRTAQYNTGEVDLDNKLKFQPLSMTFYLRPEYAIGKFFIQPQLVLDYYFPGDSNNFTALFSVNAGVMF
jgi:hypothetical protein